MILLVALVTGTCSLAVAAYLLYVEVRARRRVIRLAEADEVITTPLPIAEDMLVGAGAIGVSLYEVFAAAEDHGRVLDALARRFNNRLTDVDSPLEWMAYFVGKGPVDGVTAQGVVSAAVGQLGEDDAVEFLNNLPEFQERGIEARLFEDRSHRGTDIELVYKDGSPVPKDVLPSISVKSYEDKNSLLEVVKESDATHFLVNEEVYEQLGSEGVARLAEQGKHVESGLWSHAADKAEAEEALGDFWEAADVAEDIPIVAGLIFIGRSGANLKRCIFDRTITVHELGVDTAVDGTRLAAKSVGSIGGAKLGALVGTAFFPGPGTLIGGGVGGFLGYFSVNKLFGPFKDWIKYSKLAGALDELGAAYQQMYLDTTRHADQVTSRLREAFYDWSAQEAEWKAMDRFSDAYEQEEALYVRATSYRQPTPMGALLRRHNAAVRAHAIATEVACRSFIPTLMSTCRTVANSDAERAGRLFAATLSERPDLFPARDAESALDRYQAQRRKYRRHPYQLTQAEGDALDTNEVIEGLLAEGYAPDDIRPVGNRAGKMVPWIVASLLIAALCLWLIMSALPNS